jgi:hypothetical protein
VPGKQPVEQQAGDNADPQHDFERALTVSGTKSVIVDISPRGGISPDAVTHARNTRGLLLL